MSLKLASIETLFPIPLVTFEVGDCERLNRQLLAEIAGRRESEEGIHRSNRSGWHSKSDLFERKEKGHSELAQMIIASITGTTRQLAPETDLAGLELLCEGWINVNPTGAYNTPHDHPGNFWSGCYYVTTPMEADGPRNSGMIEFLDPRPSRLEGPVRGDFTVNKSRVQPTPGMLLLFPSNLKHWVHPNGAAEDRVTIAFNARFRRKAGAGGRPRS